MVSAVIVADDSFVNQFGGYNFVNSLKHGWQKLGAVVSPHNQVDFAVFRHLSELPANVFGVYTRDNLIAKAKKMYLIVAKRSLAEQVFPI